MQTTKIIRRIDELGRIVVPKEIRRTLKLRTNDTLEIFSEGDTLILKKYSPYHSEYDTCVCLTAGLKNITKRVVKKRPIIKVGETQNNLQKIE